MAILVKQIFDNPYIDIGKDNDMQAHKDETDYAVDAALQKKLSGQKIFKLFQNSNTPFVLCKDHVHEIDALLQEEF